MRFVLDMLFGGDKPNYWGHSHKVKKTNNNNNNNNNNNKHNTLT